MRLLLLNNNPAVSRLIKLSAEKAGYELDEFEDYGLVPLSSYDVILVDNELYDNLALEGLREQTGFEYSIYICQRGAQKPELLDVALEKPFLPTDFLVLLEKVKNLICSHHPEEGQEEIKALSTSQINEEEPNAFDIDQINTFEIEDEVAPLNFLDDEEDDLKEAKAEELGFDDLELDDLNFANDLSSDDEPDSDKELSFVSSLEEDLNLEDKDKDEEKFEDFDFEEESEEVSMASNIQEEEVVEEVTPCVLDKDDINEVKQLLDENEEEEESLDLSLDLLETTDKNTDDEGEFSFDDNMTEEEPIEKKLSLDLDDLSGLDLDEETLSDVNETVLENSEEEEQEEVIDDFVETIDEKIEEEKEEEMQFEEAEEIIPQVNVALHASCEASSAVSLDDLDENLIKKAFGEEVEEEISAPAPTVSTEDKTQEIEVIRGELENSVARSISGLAQSDILKEALKGMRINISITFDEKE